MTEEELATILTNLIAHLKQMRDDRRGSALNAPSGSGNAGKAPKRAKSKLPCSADLLDWEHQLGPTLSEAAEELYDNHPGECWRTPRMETSRGNDSVAWAEWLAHPRHQPLILSDPTWYFIETLRETEDTLRHMLNPQDPHHMAETMSGIVTVDYLKESGFKAGTIRQWRARGVLEKQGEQRLSSGETIDLYKFTRPIRAMNQ